MRDSVQRFGLTEVYKPPSPDVDIVLVHGLNGHPYDTWASTSEANDDVFWPTDLLPNDLRVQSCRILVYGYDADINERTGGDATKDLIHHHAETLAARLVANRSTEARQRPIIFVCHSLGGIVVKRALIHSESISDPKLERLRSIYVSTYGLLFLGTPHNGSDVNKLNLILQSLMIADVSSTSLEPSSHLVEAFKSNGEIIQNINRLFIEISSRYSIFFFHEGKPMRLKGISDFVVDEDSAAPTIAGVERSVIEKDHLQMCRFEDKRSPGYDLVSEAIQRYALESLVTVERRWKAENHLREKKRQEVAHDVLGTSVTMHSSTSSTTIWYVPFDHLPEFIGRKKEINYLRERLFESQGGRTVAIFGLGGIGKTRIAWEIADYARSHIRTCSVFWIQATSLSSFEGDCFEIARRLKILPPQNENCDAKQLIKQYLSTESVGRWLIILDNADDEILWCTRSSNSDDRVNLAEFIPKNSQSSVLITTRFRKVAQWHARLEHVELKQMDLTEAVDMFISLLKHQNEKINPGTVSTLVEKLACLPLAISQAAAYLEMNDTTPEVYLKLLDSDAEEDVVQMLSEDFGDSSRYGNAQNPIVLTYLTSFKQMQSLYPASVEYLCFMACLHEKNIPHSLLPTVSEMQSIKIIAVLTGYGFIRKQNANETPFQLYDMHRLVRLATRNWLRSRDSLSSTVNRVVGQIAQQSPGDFSEGREIWTIYVAHTQVLLDEIRDEYPEQRYLLLQKLADYQLISGRYWDAFRTLRMCESWCEGHKKPDMDISSLHSDLGFSLTMSGAYSEAEQYIEKAIQGARELRGDTDPAGLRYSTQLTDCYIRQGRLALAETLGSRILKVQQTVLGPEHRDTVTTERCLARTYIGLDRCDEAANLLEKIAGIYQSEQGGEYIRSWGTYHALSIAYLRLGRLPEAEQLILKLVSNTERLFEERHPTMLLARQQLARLYFEQNREQEAETSFATILSVMQSVLGIDHQDTIVAMLDLAFAKLSNARGQEAKDLFDKCLELASTRYGPEFQLTLECKQALDWYNERMERDSDN